MAAGDVLFFNGSVIHGSFPNASRDRFRRALIGHYVAGEAEKVSQFYHPVLRMDGSEGGNRRQRERRAVRDLVDARRSARRRAGGPDLAAIPSDERPVTRTDEARLAGLALDLHHRSSSPLFNPSRSRSRQMIDVSRDVDELRNVLRESAPSVLGACQVPLRAGRSPDRPGVDPGREEARRLLLADVRPGHFGRDASGRRRDRLAIGRALRVTPGSIPQIPAAIPG